MTFENINVRKWYMKTYPADDLGSHINSALTFGKVMNSLNNYENIYQTIGVGDSIIRERIFAELAVRQGLPYEKIYDKWLDAVRPRASVLKKLEEKKSEVSVNSSFALKHESLTK